MSEFFIAKQINFVYSSVMYITEKELKFHLREMNSNFKDLASDLGGDIRYLHQEIHELREYVSMMETELQSLREQLHDT